MSKESQEHRERVRVDGDALVLLLSFSNQRQELKTRLGPTPFFYPLE